jgi:hypothetical protein
MALGFLIEIEAVAMTLGGIAELFLGVGAEGRSRENIPIPLTAEEAEACLPGPARRHPGRPDGSPAG